jgi:hypothetical protein
MTDARADDAVLHLDRLGAVILDDMGDGPAGADLSARATEARDAVAGVGIAAFNEVTGLVVEVATSIASGATDWSPSLGGTLMAAVDDLRTLIMRAAQFSSEDSEHLHQRAAELAVYVHLTRDAPALPHEPAARGSMAATLPEPAATVSAQMPPTSAPAGSPSSTPEQPPPVPAPTAESQAPKIVPISDLFYADGPQVVSGGVPASAGKKSDLLGVGIEALESLSAQPLAPQSSTGPMVIVPVDTLLYRGRAALERAAAIREQIKASGAHASPAALDEMYDLIGLALKD